MDHCVLALNDFYKNELYQSYITDGLKCISESVAGYLGGPYMQARFYDLLNGSAEDEVTADEIVLDIIERAGLKVRS